MIKNYIKIALRSLSKNKLYAIINILGLATGLTVYVFASILADYERNHDTMWANSDRIYTVGATFNPNLQVGINETDGAQHALGPILKTTLPDAEMIARTIRREFVVSVSEDSYYQPVVFADPDLLHIFDFKYIAGDSNALDNPSGAVISQNLATKLFRDENPMGKTIFLDRENALTVVAVLEDLSPNTHFNSSIIQSDPLDILIPMKALERITGFNPNENWGNLSIGNMTYVLLPQNLDGAWLKDQLTTVEETLVPERLFETIEHFTVYPLKEANLFIWRGLGVPMMTVLKFLGLLVLVVACINYTNLATAQSLGRAREVGLRKTLGAKRNQLLMQFFVESITTAALAMAVALMIIEMVLPIFNTATNKIMTLNYLSTLPWIMGTTLLVGLLAGGYPALLITKTQPIDALRDTARKGTKGSWFRSIMIGTQFMVSVMLLTMVSVMYVQNKKVEDSSNIFPKDEIYTLKRVGVDSIEAKHEALRNELLALPGVTKTSYSSQVPFEQNNNSFTASVKPGDRANGFSINILRADHTFFDVYDIPLIAGRYPNKSIAGDTYVEEVNAVNVLINELAVSKFGFSSAEDALGKTFYDDNDTQEGETSTLYTIVGVVPDQNILGMHNSIKPWVFYVWPERYDSLSIRLTGDDVAGTVANIEQVWKRIIPDYPFQGRYLNDEFRTVYSIFETGNAVLAGFAGLALILALIGLFGLAAFMAAQRTKEIGIRKVMGANTGQIAKLLILKFSKPVMIAAPIALILAYLGTQAYLDFFADRIGTPYGIILIAGIVSILFAWATVSIHAIKVARQNPITALRHE